MKKLKFQHKFYLQIGFLLLVMFVTITFMSWSFDSLLTEFKEPIGNKYIFEKDTVLVLSADMWNDSYTLSNGLTIESNFLEKLTKINN